MNFYNPGIFIALLLLALCRGVSAQQAGADRTAAQNLAAAEDFMARRQWPSALEALNLSLAKDATLTEAYYTRALVHERLGNDSDALTDLNIYLEFRPDHYEALLSRAQLRMRSAQYDLAKADFVRLLTLSPGETTAVFFQTDQVTGGVSGIFSARGASRAQLFNFIGLADTRLGNFAEAVVVFDSAIAAAPGVPDYWVNRGLARVGMGDTAAAVTDYRQALGIDPRHALAKHNLWVVRGKSEGSAMLDHAIDDNPNMPFAWAERAYYKQENKQWKGALADYNQAIRLDPDEKEYYLNRGLVKEKLHDNSGAYEDITKALELDGRFDKAWLSRGNLMTRLGHYPEAIEDYTAAITWSPAYSAAWYNRALARDRMHQKAAACYDLEQAEKLGMAIPPKVKGKLCGQQP